MRLIPRAEAAGLRQAANLAAVGGIATLIGDFALGIFTTGGAQGVAKALVFPVNLVAAVIAYRAAQAWQRAQIDTTAPPRGFRFPPPWINAVITFFIPYIVLPIEAVAGWVRISRGKADLVPDPDDRSLVEAEHRAAVDAWQQRINQFEAAEKRRFETVDVWYPVTPSSTARMVCVFGGSHISWAAALATIGASLIGSGFDLVIGDLSRRRTPPWLLELCDAYGVSSRAAVLPAEAEKADLFAGLSWTDLSTILVEVLHSANQDADASRRERQEDRAVIRDFARIIDRQNGVVSLARLRRALLVVQGAHDPMDDELISVDEFDRLASLYNEVQREYGGVLQRVTRIERALRDFVALDQGGPDLGDGEHPTTRQREKRGNGAGCLEIVEVDKRSDDLDNDRLVDLLFQLLLRRVRTSTSRADVLIILGADRIRRDQLESLVNDAQQDNMGVLLFFEHLRADATDIVGGGGASAVFFALGNNREAKEASDFIGSAWRWRESTVTRSESDSLTETWGKSEGETGHGWSTGKTYSRAEGRATESAHGEQLVREAVVDPEVLMGLPATGMIFIEVLLGGRRVIKNVDCLPNRRLDPRVAAAPVPLLEAR